MTTDNDAPAAGLVEALQFYADPTHWRTANSDGSTRNDGVGLGYHQTGDGIMEVQGSHCGHWVPSNQMVHGGHWQADSGHIARRALAALQAPQEAGVSVKALEWEEDLESICTRATANALGGKMIVVELDPGSGDYSAGIDLGGLCFRLIQDAYHDDRGVPYSAPAKFSTIEAAKAAAQADFEARILSQIISQPAARQGIATTAPFTFSRYINGQLMAEGVTIERQATIEGAAREAARIASRGPNGEVPVLVLIAPEALSQPVATPAPSQDAAVTETELMRLLVRELGGYSVTIVRDGRRMVGWCTGRAGNSIAMSDILSVICPAPSQDAAVGLRDAEAMAWIFERAEVWTPSADTTRMNGPSVAATIRWLIAATRPTPSQDAEVKARVTVPAGQTPLNDKLGHVYLDVFNEGAAARDSGKPSPYHGHSLEHCLHAAGWVQRDLRLALDAAKAAAPRPAEAMPVAEGWIVGSGDGKCWRQWADGDTRWTDDPGKATRFARREDAEAVHHEDEDAWRVVPLIEALAVPAPSQDAAVASDTPIHPQAGGRDVSGRTDIREEIADTQARLDVLKKQLAEGSCTDIGHDWQSIGGCNCGCHPDAGCSVPVLQCTRCGDCDYGDGTEANEQRSRCLARKDYEDETASLQEPRP